MKKILAVAVALAMLSVAMPTAEAKTQVTNYIAPQPYAATAVWCAAGGHEYTPIGDPSDYGGNPDPVDDPVGFVNAVDSWAWSGEPECLAGDVAFGTDDDWGINGAAYYTGDEDVGSTFTVTINDDNFDTSFVYAYASVEDGDNVVDQGCGAASFIIPEGMAPHWQGSDANPYFLIWALIDGAYVDQDTFETCFASQGTATGVWGH